MIQNKSIANPIKPQKSIDKPKSTSTKNKKIKNKRTKEDEEEQDQIRSSTELDHRSPQQEDGEALERTPR